MTRREGPLQQLALAAATVVIALALGLAFAGSWSSAASATSARATYGSGWSRFEAGFPVTPTKASPSQLKKIGGSFGKVRGVVAYYVTRSGKNVFRDGAPLALVAPTEAVEAARFSGAANVLGLLGEIEKLLPKGKLVTDNGFSGLRIVISTKHVPLASGTVTGPKSFFGALVLARGDTLFEVEAIETTRARASAFLSSFKPLG